MMRIVMLLTACLLCGVALATTWAPSEKTDPLSGEKVASQEIMSYGSYIYNWPSKYDLVFWPLTDQNWICVNPNNGYAAFNDDFEQLTDEDKKTLSGWLKTNYQPEQKLTTYIEKLSWLERVYSQRTMDDDFWSRFYRLMAYVHKEDEKTSMTYVKKVLPLEQKKLEAKPEGVDKLITLYILGEYHRRLGEKEQAEEYFAQVKDVTYLDEDGKEQVGHPYFIGLVEDRSNLLNDKPSKKQDTGDGK